MDVVRTNVEKIGGKVEIDSRAGKGTTLRLRIPLTLAIIPALTLPLLRLLPLEHASHVVLTIIAVQPAAMSSVYMAEIYHSDAHFAAAGVMTTHILCLATIPLWLHFIM
jgi:chemotaxis protein histidine kinase CheA